MFFFNDDKGLQIEYIHIEKNGRNAGALNQNAQIYKYIDFKS